MTTRGDKRGHDAPLKPIGIAAGLASLLGLGALALGSAMGRRREAHAPQRGGYERRDAPPKWVAAGLAGLLSLIGIGAFVAWAILAGFGGARPAPTLTGFDRAAAIPASPRLEVDQTRDRIALDAQAEARLTGYGWTNQAAGLAHIPIERAMALHAAQGWPDAAANAAAPAPSTAGAAAPANATAPPATTAVSGPPSNAARPVP